MKNINEYKRRFNTLMESTMGDVKPLIMEQKPGDDAPLEQLPKEIQDFVKRYNLSGSFNYSSVNGKIGIRFGYNKGNTHSDIAASDIQTYEANKEKLSQCQERSKFFKETYNNLLTGTNGQSQDPQNQDPKRKAYTEATTLMNQKFPNMEFCGMVQKVDNIIKM